MPSNTSRFFTIRIYKNTLDMRNAYVGLFKDIGLTDNKELIKNFNKLDFSESLKRLKEISKLIYDTIVFYNNKIEEYETKYFAKAFSKAVTGHNLIELYTNIKIGFANYLPPINAIINKINSNQIFYDDLLAVIKYGEYFNKSLLAWDNFIAFHPSDFNELVIKDLKNIYQLNAGTLTGLFTNESENDNYIELVITDINIERDLDSIIHSITINNVLLEQIEGVGKYDKVIVRYYESAGNSTIIFKGWIEDFDIDLGIDGEYATIYALGNLSVLQRTPLPNAVQGTSLDVWLNEVLKINQAGIKIEKYWFEDFNIAAISEVNKEGNCKEKIDEVRKKYPVYMTESKEGNMRLISPFYLYDNTNSIQNGYDFSNYEQTLKYTEDKFVDAVLIIEKKKRDVIKDKEVFVLPTQTINRLKISMSHFYNLILNRSKFENPYDDEIKNFNNVIYGKTNDPTGRTINYNIKAIDEGIFNYLVELSKVMTKIKDFVIKFLQNIEGANSQFIGEIRRSNLEKTMSDFSNTTDLNVWELDYQENVSSVKIKSNTGYVNAVFLLGKGSDDIFTFGLALDAYDVLINNKQLIPRIERSYDISDTVVLDKEAAKRLLELKNSYDVTCVLNDFIPGINVGDYAILKNVPTIPSQSSEKVYEGIIFIIKKLTHTINNKELTTTITLHANHLESVPQSILSGADAKSLGLLSKDFIFNYLGDIEGTGITSFTDGGGSGIGGGGGGAG